MSERPPARATRIEARGFPASKMGTGKYIFTPPRASTTLANVSKFSST